MVSVPRSLPMPRFALCMAVVLSVATWLVVPVAAAEEGFDAQTRSDLQGVITRQLDAFDHGDAEAAEKFAAPGIQQRFPEPGKFLDMVRSNYGALIHPKSTQFMELTPSPHGPLQRLTVVAADGTVWSAIYAFERVDGQWRISGCGIEKDTSQQDI